MQGDSIDKFGWERKASSAECWEEEEEEKEEEEIEENGKEEEEADEENAINTRRLNIITTSTR